MAKIVRQTAVQFGTSAGSNQIAQFGSLNAGSPTLYSGSTAAPSGIQNLSNWQAGWFNAVVGANSPAIEDLNAFCFVTSYQIAYQMQEGIPEWDSGTNYYIGSIAQDGSGNIYVSKTNSNLNNALTSSTNWRLLIGNNSTVVGPSSLTGAVSATTGPSSNITNANASITIAAGQVRVTITSDPSNQPAYFAVTGSSTSSSLFGFLQIQNTTTSVNIGEYQFGVDYRSSSTAFGNNTVYGPVSMSFIDTAPAVGSNTYSLTFSGSSKNVSNSNVNCALGWSGFLITLENIR